MATANNSFSTCSSSLDDPARVASLTWAKDGKVINNPNRKVERHLDQWPFPDRESLPLDFVESMPLDVPARALDGAVHDHANLARLSVVLLFCDIPVFNEGKWRSRSSATCRG